MHFTFNFLIRLRLTKLCFRFYRIFVRRIQGDNTQLNVLPATSTFVNDNDTSADSNIFYVTYHQEQFVEEALNITVGDGTINQGTVKQMSLHISILLIIP